jgi:hypothetical protein
MRLTANPDGTFTLGTPPGHSETLTAAQLPARLTFYSGLRDRGSKKPGTPGPYAEFYAETVTELEQTIRALSKP